MIIAHAQRECVRPSCFVAAATVCLVVLFGSCTFAQQTVARKWNEALLDAIRIDYPAPTVHSRNLLHTSAAMYDAWAAYDDVAVGYLHNEPATADDVAAARDAAISYAAYGVLSSRFVHSPGADESLDSFDVLMESLGYDWTFTSTEGDSPAALGNRIAQTIIDYGLSDGSNEANEYVDNTGYAPVNEPMIVKLPGTTMVDKNRWQPLSLDFFVAQNGLPLPIDTQTFLGPHWGNVIPFALKKKSPDNPYLWSAVDPGPPPQLGGAGDVQFKRDIVSVIRYSSELTPDDGVEIDISPASLGNRPLGTHDDRGFAVNPFTGQPYQPNIVKRGDYGRMLTEFRATVRSAAPPPRSSPDSQAASIFPADWESIIFPRTRAWNSRSVPPRT